MDPGDEGIEVDDLLDPREFDHFTYAESLEHLKLDEPNQIGYVYRSLGSAIVSLRMAMRALACRDDPISAETLFEELIVNLIMEGGDADTNAAVAGALLGAYLG
jgi:ADP-ribosylglycohydrolase